MVEVFLGETVRMLARGNRVSNWTSMTGAGIRMKRIITCGLIIVLGAALIVVLSLYLSTQAALNYLKHDIRNTRMKLEAQDVESSTSVRLNLLIEPSEREERVAVNGIVVFAPSVDGHKKAYRVLTFKKGSRVQLAIEGRDLTGTVLLTLREEMWVRIQPGVPGLTLSKYSIGYL